MILNNFISLLFEKAWFFYGNLRASFFGVRLGRGARISPKAKIKKAYYVGNAIVASKVIMGEGSYINSGIIFSGAIGKYCSIGYNVLIGPTEHNPNNYTTSPFLAKKQGYSVQETEINKKQPIINDEVWIGANVVILKGVEIGRGSIIAAGAIVNKNIPEMEIWGGVPAKFIKKRVVCQNNG